MIVSIIGTRPQYIKVKPIYDYCRRNSIEHVIIDTNQHYDKSVSENIINDLELKIDHNLNVDAETELGFMHQTLRKLEKKLSRLVAHGGKLKAIVYGDTNSSFCAAMACYKMKIPFAHVESGVRCFNDQVPEEINRKFIDSVADYNFCSALRDRMNVQNCIYSGDLEYELLNTLNPEVTHQRVAVLTLHRQENMNPDRIREIFEFCRKLKNAIVLPLHHRLKNQHWFREIIIPENVQITQPFTYTSMVALLAKCKFILTDSGSVPKTAPFFGKKALVFRNELGWSDTIDAGYCKTYDRGKADELITWLNVPREARQRTFYMKPAELPSETILNHLINE